MFKCTRHIAKVQHEADNIDDIVRRELQEEMLRIAEILTCGLQDDSFLNSFSMGKEEDSPAQLGGRLNFLYK